MIQWHEVHQDNFHRVEIEPSQRLRLAEDQVRLHQDFLRLQRRQDTRHEPVKLRARLSLETQERNMFVSEGVI